MTAPVLKVQGLAKSYPVSRGLFSAPASLQALSGVSFTLAPGETLAVVGESGSGKSTLARQITLMEQPDAGTIELNGRDVTALAGEERRIAARDVQMIFQNPAGALNPRRTVGAALEAPLIIAGNKDRADRRARLEKAMTAVGLPIAHLDRYPHMFSGGQRQRIAIARALMLGPKVIVADEPVSALDVSVQAQILNLLATLQDQTGMAILLISHDLGVVKAVADRVAVMYLGRFVETGPAAEVLTRPAYPYTRALIAATPGLNRRGASAPSALEGELPSPLDPPPGCAFAGRCPMAQESCRAARPDLTNFAKAGPDRAVACFRADALWS